ncbi:MAG: hypothetical protein WA840_00665, partial [Caulobacteraceae bacterium]
MLLRCATLLFALLLAPEARACDALLGDYAAQPGKAAMLRIEHAPSGGYSARTRGDDGAWKVDAVPAGDAMTDVAALLKADCALNTPYGAVVKLPVGGPYRTLPGSNQDVRTSRTGYLLLILEGFQADAADLYPTPRQGEPPTPAPPPPPPPSGQEVSAAPACPGGGRPDMTQQAFDALPARERDDFHARPAEWRSAYLCGQYLDDLMTKEAHIGFDPKTDRLQSFHLIERLLDAGQAPRTAEGALDWWPAAADFLVQNRPADPHQKAPHREEGYALFQKAVIYRLPYPGPDDLSGYPSKVEQFTAEAAHMPQAIALVALDRLRQMGVLELSPQPDSDDVAARILWSVLGADVSDEAFELIAKAAGPNAARDQELLRRAVDD